MSDKQEAPPFYAEVEAANKRLTGLFHDPRPGLMTWLTFLCDACQQMYDALEKAGVRSKGQK
jgi:hypothetical protein